MRDKGQYMVFAGVKNFDGPWGVRALPGGEANRTTAITARYIMEVVDQLEREFKQKLPPEVLEELSNPALAAKAKGVKAMDKGQEEVKITDDKSKAAKAAQESIQDFMVKAKANPKYAAKYSAESMGEWYSTKPVQALEAIRFKAYGLKDMERSPVLALRWMEWNTLKDIKSESGDKVTWQGPIS